MFEYCNFPAVLSADTRWGPALLAPNDHTPLSIAPAIKKDLEELAHTGLSSVVMGGMTILSQPLVDLAYVRL